MLIVVLNLNHEDEEDDEDDFEGNASGEIEPRLTMYLMPSATLMSSFVTLSSGTSTRKPEVGFGVVGNEDGDHISPSFFAAPRRAARW